MADMRTFPQKIRVKSSESRKNELFAGLFMTVEKCASFRVENLVERKTFAPDLAFFLNDPPATLLLPAP